MTFCKPFGWPGCFLFYGKVCFNAVFFFTITLELHMENTRTPISRSSWDFLRAPQTLLIWSGIWRNMCSFCRTAKGMFHTFNCLAHTQQPRTTPCAPGELETKCDEREDPTTLMPFLLWRITDSRVLVLHQLLPWVMIAGCSGTLWRWCTRHGLSLPLLKCTFPP